LCRCINRAALANERLQYDAAGQVAPKLKAPWLEGTTYIVMVPLDFVWHLAAGYLPDIKLELSFVRQGLQVNDRRAREPVLSLQGTYHFVKNRPA
jgi:hypothetical protein